MFKPSALNTTVVLAALFATIASAAESVDNYTGTIADLVDSGDAKILENMKVAIEVDQTASQVTYDFTVSGALRYTPDEYTYAAIGLCYPTAADAYDCV